MIKGGEQLNRLSVKGANKDSSPFRESELYLREKLGPELPLRALILGSGFQRVLESFQVEAELNVAEIVGFPRLQVQGHSGRLLVARIEGLRVLVLSGRPHFYEGHSMEAVMFPVRLLAQSGVNELVVTNAAGGINPAYHPGDFMIFSDHINLIGVNPLRGLPVENGHCFVDLTDTYCAGMRATFQKAAQQESISLHEGVYVGVSGPSYETPAEIRAFRSMGGDAVGMSTIPEVLMARYCGIKVAALSCITNHAAGMHPTKLSHREVLEAGQKNATNAARLLRRFAIDTLLDAKT